MVGAELVLPRIEPGGATPFTRIQFWVPLALNPTEDWLEVTVRVCAGGAGLVVVATQKLRLGGLTLTVLFWAIAVSRQPNATNSTKTVKVIELNAVFTRFSTGPSKARFHCKQ